MLEQRYHPIALKTLRRLWPTRLFSARKWYSEPVELCLRRFGYQPAIFRWRGMLHRVARIERVWEQAGRRGQAARRYFEVRCCNGKQYILFQDLTLGVWRLMLLDT